MEVLEAAFLAFESRLVCDPNLYICIFIVFVCFLFVVILKQIFESGFHSL